jgi:putative transposase
MIEPNHPTLPITRQCPLVGISRPAFYGGPRIESAENLALMRAIDEQFMETPRYGSRQMARHLRRRGHSIGRKRVRQLMARMGLAADYQRPRTTVRHPQHRIWPDLLTDLVVDRPDQV